MKTAHRFARRSAGLFAAVLAASAAPAFADETDKAQIRELAAKIEALQAQLKAIVDQQNAAPAAQAPSAAAVVTEGALPGSFKMPGTETSVKIGGFAALDIVKDFTGGGMGGAVAQPQSIAFDGSPKSERDGQLSMTARRSRLYLRTLTPTPLGDVLTHIEGDFIGSGGNELVTNSSSPRLRHAYVELGPWLAGQFWTNFADLATFPETVDFQGGHGMAQAIRQPQLRYTKKWGAHEFAAAIENPEADIVGMSVSSFNPGVGPVPTTHVDELPDLTARYAFSGHWGRVALGGVARKLSIDNRGAGAIGGFVGDDSVTAGGLMLAGRIKTGGKDSIQFGIEGGRGLGRYITGAPIPTAAVMSDGSLNAVKSWGAMLGYQHHWSPTLRSNVTYGQVRLDNPHPAMPKTAVSRVDALFVNLIWQPIPRALVGIEYVRGEVENDEPKTATLSNKGRADRLGATVQYHF
ncbi:DcaP family trimeric outer membrane transporter [Aromatoleum anaerobium]|uniref:Porin n=1 Tax=Aromatoleum anaerobium TaxID=182180 RepID=A0ABX1PUH5_9RHOO|nr:DcaP family trimeric outer membrane transporter [Aromatoleum anaerobium]MCK0506582.1 porin [Aromatoleum anaerobium]